MNQQGDKKQYEIAFMVKSQSGQAVMENILSQHSCNVILRGPLVETRLAYPIKKLNQAYFGYLHFSAMPDQVEKINFAVKINPEVLRALIVTLPEGKMAEERGKRKEERSFKKTEIPVLATVGGIMTNEALEEKLEEILK